ncbi:MAG: class I SAM-dependent methyltransferase [Nannocystis sp.]|jgi:SAM-dependent methyltransferase|nr:class I SAM-dependent methyltransferase [Nannocystis sp.]
MSSIAAYDPELYALLHVGNAGDLDFYREACSTASSVLELGCGHGRVLRALASEGKRIVGLEIDAGLLGLAERLCSRLRQAEAASISLVRGDMRDFEIEGRFERIIIPYSGLYCLSSSEERRRCLTQIRRHLAPGGEVIFDLYFADPTHDELVGEPVKEDGPTKVATLRWRDQVWEVRERSRWDPTQQRVDVIYEHVPKGGGAPVLTSLCHHYLRTGELLPLFANAGLALEALAGDFVGGPLREESELVVGRARAQ